MIRIFLFAVAAIGLAGSALAQTGGSTYPQGSNLPQRSAGEVAPKPDGAASGSAAPNSSAHVQKKSASKNGAKPRHRPRTRH
jgi:hypothetical protein